MHLLLEEEVCPVPDEMLGALYRASSYGLDDLVSSVPTQARAMLALYCYRRKHLQSVGLAIAAGCEEGDLSSAGGKAGSALFEKARQAPEKQLLSYYEGRKKVSLSKGLLRTIAEADDGVLLNVFDESLRGDPSNPSSITS